MQACHATKPACVKLIRSILLSIRKRIFINLQSQMQQMDIVEGSTPWSSIARDDGMEQWWRDFPPRYPAAHRMVEESPVICIVYGGLGSNGGGFSPHHVGCGWRVRLLTTVLAERLSVMVEEFPPAMLMVGDMVEQIPPCVRLA